MICLLSPAKTMISSDSLAADNSHCLPEKSLPVYRSQASVLGKFLKSKTKGELKSLCGVSDSLSVHVKGLYTKLLVDDDDLAEVGCSHYNQAALMFDGPAFRGLDAGSVNASQGLMLQKHLRILSGLYGIVRPGDLIQEYRLCMGTKLKINEKTKDLYSFWGNLVAENVLKDLQLQKSNLSSKNKKSIPTLVINCASQEYSKCILPHLPQNDDVRIVECAFYDDGIIKSTYAKRARGLMARFVCLNGINSGEDSEVDKIKLFDTEGYCFSKEKSSRDCFVFCRSSANVPSSCGSKGGKKSTTKRSALDESHEQKGEKKRKKRNP